MQPTDPAPQDPNAELPVLDDQEVLDRLKARVDYSFLRPVDDGYEFVIVFEDGQSTTIDASGWQIPAMAIYDIDVEANWPDADPELTAALYAARENLFHTQLMQVHTVRCEPWNASYSVRRTESLGQIEAALSYFYETLATVKRNDRRNKDLELEELTEEREQELLAEREEELEERLEEEREEELREEREEELREEREEQLREERRRRKRDGGSGFEIEAMLESIQMVATVAAISAPGDHDPSQSNSATSSLGNGYETTLEAGQNRSR
ncbi:hypothetical protein [Micromonospora sp. SH-82]|uniref:hypothetical protein n=1 Tax=Micromonospora sp. SH-82 TaxID=3132938 RepID=UPI003EBD3A4E